MKTETLTIYSCEHCKKMYKRQHAALHHEKYCAKNPLNFHKCFSCQHLSVGQETYDGGFYDRMVVKTFTCTKLDKELHSFKAEKCNHACLGHTERMPLECDSFLLHGMTDMSQDIMDACASAAAAALINQINT